MLVFSIATLLLWIHINILSGTLVGHYFRTPCNVPFASKSSGTDKLRIAFQYAKWGYICT